ncbi:hypothetical protein [Vibrio atypicus]|uniref:hypothetical protein n=1 Tax=Vibrio atypicus TaxID=558271 RepID=UPI0013592314|nr:hypothetical protein [Vibrio atypicus]
MKYSPINRFWMLCFLVLSASVQAIEISTMFTQFEDDKASIIIKNTAQQRIFLFVGMSKLQVVEGEIQKTEYSKHNLADWEISVSPAKTIIEPGFEKQLTIDYQCKKQCDTFVDKLYQLSIVPAPYVPESEQNQNAVQIAVGFAPILVKVNKEHSPDYVVHHQGEQVTFTNRGDSYFQAVLRSCLDRQECERQFKILAGRTLTIQLPEKMVNQNLNLELHSAHGEYKQERLLLVDEVVETL